MTDRGRQGVGRIEGDPGALAGQEGKDHGPDLGLLGVPVADDRFLDEPRLVLEDRDGETRSRGQQDPPRVGELDGGGDVFRREDGLDRDGGGAALREKSRRGGPEELELLREREPGRRAPDAAALEL